MNLIARAEATPKGSSLPGGRNDEYFEKRRRRGLALAASLAAAAAATERWKAPVAVPTNLPGFDEGLKDWAATMNAADADIQVKLYDPGEIVPAFSVLDAVQNNKVSAGFDVLGFHAGTIPAAALLFGAPFGLGPRAYAGWHCQGGGEKLTQDLIAKNGVHAILCMMTGPEMGGWFREPIASLDDIKGLRFRMAGLGAQTLTKPGMSVTTLPPGETFPALERGAIDAAEGSMPSVDVMLGLHKVAKHGCIPGWHQPFGAGHLIVNQQVWDGLSETRQDAVQTVCDSAAMKNFVMSDAISADAMAKAVADGAIIHTFPDDMIAACRAANSDVMAEMSAADADFKAISDSMEAHRARVNGYISQNSVD